MRPASIQAQVLEMLCLQIQRDVRIESVMVSRALKELDTSVHFDIHILNPSVPKFFYSQIWVQVVR